MGNILSIVEYVEKNNENKSEIEELQIVMRY